VNCNYIFYSCSHRPEGGQKHVGGHYAVNLHQ
jgi:hypothetical protein